MPRNRNITGKVFTAAVFLILEIAALSMLRNGSTVQSMWLSRMSHSFMGAVWGGTQAVRQYFSLRGQNDALAEENFALRMALLRYREAELPETHGETVRGFSYIPAEVIKVSRNRQHNYMIINKGSDDGVTTSSGIITGKGVIGIIDAVDRRHSFALTLMNPAISISARLGTEGAVGPLVWDGVSQKGAILKEIPLQYAYEPGDTVYTSGYSSIFPPDIPLGTAGEAKLINGATNEIRVTLFQDFSALRYVTVVSNTELKELEALEQ